MATPDILRSARKEEAELVKQLEHNPLYQRLVAVRQLIATYSATIPAPTPAPAVVAPQQVVRRIAPAEMVEKVKAHIRSTINDFADAAEAVIQDRGRPVPRKELYDALVARGIEIGGKDPLNTMSARLYNSKRFTSTPEGYVIRPLVLQELDEPENTEAADLAGSTASDKSVLPTDTTTPTRQEGR